MLVAVLTMTVGVIGMNAVPSDAEAAALADALCETLIEVDFTGFKDAATQVTDAHMVAASDDIPAHCIRFLRRLLEQASGRVYYLIVDGHPVHRSDATSEFVGANEQRPRLIRLPEYCPELNPDELLDQDVKNNSLGKSRHRNRTEMLVGVRSHLQRRHRQPQIIRDLCHEEHVRYAA